MKPIARTIAPMQLVFCDDEETMAKALVDGSVFEPYLRITKPESLEPYHFAPVQNCVLVILTQHPVLTTMEFRRLMEEKSGE